MLKSTQELMEKDGKLEECNNRIFDEAEKTIQKLINLSNEDINNIRGFYEQPSPFEFLNRLLESKKRFESLPLYKRIIMGYTPLSIIKEEAAKGINIPVKVIPITDGIKEDDFDFTYAIYDIVNNGLFRATVIYFIEDDYCIPLRDESKKLTNPMTSLDNKCEDIIDIKVRACHDQRKAENRYYLDLIHQYRRLNENDCARDS